MTATQVSPASASLAGSDLDSCYHPTLNPNITSTKTVTKVAGSTGTAVLAGDTLEYTITVRNNGTLSAGNTTFQDSIPTGTTYVAGSTTMNFAAVTDVSGAMPFATARAINSPNEGSGVVNVDNTPGSVTTSSTDTSNNEVVIKFRVTINSGVSSVSNQGTVTYVDSGQIKTDDPALPGTSDPTNTTVGQVTVTKTVSSAPQATANADEYSLTYAVKVNNGGITTATYGLTDTLGLESDAAVKSVSYTKNGSSSTSLTTSPYALAPSGTSLAAGATDTYLVTVVFKMNSYTNSANDTCTGTSGNGLFNSATVTPGSGYGSATTATACANTPTVTDLSATKDDGVTSVYANNLTTYTITVTNNGPTAATAIIRDPAVTGLVKQSTACSGTPGVCTTAPDIASLEGTGFTTPSIPVGSTYQFTVTAKSTATSGSLANTVTVTPGGTVLERNTSDNTATDTDTAGTGSLSVTKAVSSAFIKVNDTSAPTGTTALPSTALTPASLVYTIRVTNTGTLPLSNVVVTDALPAGLTYVSATLAQSTASGTYGTANAVTNNGSGQNLSFNVGTLSPTEPGKSAEIKVTANVSLKANTAASAFLNTANASATNVTAVASSEVKTDVVYSKLFKQVHTLTKPLSTTIPATSPAWSSSSSGLPGDMVEYCIDFYNNSSVPLTSYSVSDGIPPNTTYVSGSLVALQGTMKNPGAAYSGVTLSEVTANGKVVTVKAQGMTVPAGGSGTVCFRATIN